MISPLSLAREPKLTHVGNIVVIWGRQARVDLDTALMKGARWVIVGPDVSLRHLPADQRKRVRVVANPRRAYATLVQYQSGFPGRRLSVTGVTGTNGKTTVATMVHWMLNHTGKRTGLIGTIHVDTGRRLLAAGLTTPDAADLACFLSEMKAAGLTHAVMETSSHGIHQHRIDGIRYQVAVWTNWSLDHLDYHRTPKDYLNAKARLFKTLTGGSTAVLNADDPVTDWLAQQIEAPIVWYGYAPQSHVRADPIGDGRFRIRAPGLDEVTAIAGLGAHRVSNYLAALAAGFCLGVPTAAAHQALQSFPGVWRRLQMLERWPVPVVDDCAHNPENIRAAIGAISSLKPRRTLVVYAVRGSRGREVNALNAMALAAELKASRDRLFLTTAEDLAGPADRVQPEELLTFTARLEAGCFPYHFYPTVQEALFAVKAAIAPGDAVLMMGAHAMDHAQDLWAKIRIDAPTNPGPTTVLQREISP